ncbi:MAG: nicotinate (nicotinamide) nucleotide adenylyltransferase [Acidobacteria bacterium]|nr:nicotinate (nicotinamide) nucleotide adenylyltransferase [Acidobacteriota bacterium]
MKIALFGGSFDPIHHGHLTVARAAADAFDLDRVLFVVSGDPPHKAGLLRAAYEDRQRMAELACRADARFEAPRLEDPARLDGRRSYSVDTIERLQAELGPGDRLYFLLGEDAFRDLGIWHRLDDVIRSVEFLVVSRPDSDSQPEPNQPGLRAHWLRGVSNPVSSTEVRRRIAAGESVDGLMPREVAEYAQRRGLYRAAAAARPDRNVRPH